MSINRNIVLRLMLDLERSKPLRSLDNNFYRTSTMPVMMLNTS